MKDLNAALSDASVAEIHIIADMHYMIRWSHPNTFK